MSVSVFSHVLCFGVLWKIHHLHRYLAHQSESLFIILINHKWKYKAGICATKQVQPSLVLWGLAGFTEHTVQKLSSEKQEKTKQ